MKTFSEFLEMKIRALKSYRPNCVPKASFTKKPSVEKMSPIAVVKPYIAVFRAGQKVQPKK